MKSAVRSSAERSTTPVATAAARRSAVRVPAEAEVFFAAAPSIAEGRAGATEGLSPEAVLAAGAAPTAAGFFVVAQGGAEGRTGAAEGPSPEVVMAAGATWAAEGFFVAAPSIAEGRTGAAETRAASATTEGPSIAAVGEQFTAVGAFAESAHHFAEAVAHFVGAAQAAVLASAVGSDGRHRVSLPRGAAADRRERGEDLTRTDVRFAVEQLGFME